MNTNLWHISIFGSRIVFVWLLTERLCGSLAFFNFGGACEDLHMGTIYWLFCWQYEKCGTEWVIFSLNALSILHPIMFFMASIILAELLDRNSRVARRTCDVWRDSGCGWCDDAVLLLKSVLSEILSDVSSAEWNVSTACFSHDYISPYNAPKLLTWVLRTCLVWKERKSHSKQEFRRKLVALWVCKN